MKSIVLMLTFIGIISVIVGYINQLKVCPPPKIEYRYIPRTFQQEQEDPVKISQLFNTMFTQPSPWINGFNESPKNNEINRYFISQ